MPAASPGPGLLCLLLGQTLAQSQQKVREKMGDFTHEASCRGKEGAFVTTKAQSWSENLFSAQSSNPARAAVLHLPLCNQTAEPKQKPHTCACKRKGACERKAAEQQVWCWHAPGSQHTG